MTTTQIVLLVVAILVLEVMIWVPVVVWLNRKSGRLAQVIRDAASGERFLIEPEPALYRGGTSGWSWVKGNAVIALTDRRLIFNKVIGRMEEIPLSDIAGVEEKKWFLKSYRSGRPHVVLRLANGSEVGFIVRSHRLWMDTLQRFVGQQPAG